MPKKQQNSKLTKDTDPKSALESAAEVIGSTLGKIAKTTGIGDTASESSPRPAKPGKLQSKNKSRLPRKEKKRAAKASGGHRG